MVKAPDERSSHPRTAGHRPNARTGEHKAPGKEGMGSRRDIGGGICARMAETGRIPDSSACERRTSAMRGRLRTRSNLKASDALHGIFALQMAVVPPGGLFDAHRTLTNNTCETFASPATPVRPHFYGAPYLLAPNIVSTNGSIYRCLCIPYVLLTMVPRNTTAPPPNPSLQGAHWLHPLLLARALPPA